MAKWCETIHYHLHSAHSSNSARRAFVGRQFRGAAAPSNMAAQACNQHSSSLSFRWRNHDEFARNNNVGYFRFVHKFSHTTHSVRCYSCHRRSVVSLSHFKADSHPSWLAKALSPTFTSGKRYNLHIYLTFHFSFRVGFRLTPNGALPLDLAGVLLSLIPWSAPSKNLRILTYILLSTFS